MCIAKTARLCTHKIIYTQSIKQDMYKETTEYLLTQIKYEVNSRDWTNEVQLHLSRSEFVYSMLMVNTKNGNNLMSKATNKIYKHLLNRTHSTTHNQYQYAAS